MVGSREDRRETEEAGQCGLQVIPLSMQHSLAPIALVIVTASGASLCAPLLCLCAPSSQTLTSHYPGPTQKMYQ
jgi:hypothetical protein